jgi:hypothetical protein
VNYYEETAEDFNKKHYKEEVKPPRVYEIAKIRQE